MDSYKRAYAKVDLDAIKHNLTVTKNALKKDMKLAAIVKARKCSGITVYRRYCGFFLCGYT